MSVSAPSPLPEPGRARLDRRGKLVAGLAVAVAALILLVQFSGLLRHFKIPTGGMASAINPGDHLLKEGFSYLWRKPRRGDVVIFTTRGIEAINRDELYVKRVVGEPGERLRLMDGTLYVNNNPVTLSNAAGPIRYSQHMPIMNYLKTSNDTVTVPEGHYFVLGDNTTNSFDSRVWGFVSARAIKGRASLRYWPPARIGSVR